MSLVNFMKNASGQLVAMFKDGKSFTLLERQIGRLAAGSTPAASGAYKNLVTMYLNKGSYLAGGTIDFVPIGFTGTRLVAAISLNNAGLDTGNENNIVSVGAAGFISSDDNMYSIGERFLKITADATPVYLVGRVDYTVLGTSAFSTNTVMQIIKIGDQ
jgi:hypothetical protein